MIKHKILLDNRYGEKNYLVPVDEDTFKIEWNDPDGTISVHYADTEHKIIKAIDPSGGPMITLGDKFLKWEVVEIYFKDKKWYLKVKKNDNSR